MLEALEAFARYGSKKAAAESLGLSNSTFTNRLKRAQAHQALDPGIAAGMRGTGLGDISKLHSGWLKTDSASLYFRMPQEGDQTPEEWLEMVKEAFTDIPKAVHMDPPGVSNDLLNRFVIADLHMGMHAWAEQAGQDYSLKIAEKRLVESMGHLVCAAPDAEVGIVLNLGDMFHANDQKNKTPTSGHILDVDGRFAKIALRTTQAVVQCVEMAKLRHNKVIYAGIPGNHDPDQSHWLTIALMMRYEDDPQVEVLWKPRDFFFYEWGKVMLAAHHGDKAKYERLHQFIADQQAEMWGRTFWRYCDTGHVHHDNRKDIGGMHFEAHRTLAGRDAYAFGAAYTGRQTMKAITVHKTRGEIARATVGVCYDN